MDMWAAWLLQTLRVNNGEVNWLRIISEHGGLTSSLVLQSQ